MTIHEAILALQRIQRKEARAYQKKAEKEGRYVDFNLAMGQASHTKLYRYAGEVHTNGMKIVEELDIQYRGKYSDGSVEVKI